MFQIYNLMKQEDVNDTAKFCVRLYNRVFFGLYAKVIGTHSKSSILLKWYKSKLVMEF